MSTSEKWERRTFYIKYKNKTFGDLVLKIDEGSGDNLTWEDKEDGFVDYFNLEVYAYDDFDMDDVYNDSIGGGFLMTKEMLIYKFADSSFDDVVDFIFEKNGEDDNYELYAKKKPDYEIIGVE